MTKQSKYVYNNSNNKHFIALGYNNSLLQFIFTFQCFMNYWISS